MRTENKFDGENEEKRKLKTLMDYEMLLQEIRLAHVGRDKEKLDQLFTELCEATIKAEEGYKIQQTSFRTLVYKQYSKVVYHVTLTCDSFEDVFQSVLTGIYDGSVFFRRLKKIHPDKWEAEIKNILNARCWCQINDFICNQTGTQIGTGVRDDFGIPDERFKVECDGKIYRNHITMISMQKELDNAGSDASVDTISRAESELQHLLKSELSLDPIDELIDAAEKSPMEEVAIKLAHVLYEEILSFKYDACDRADILRYAHQVQNPVKPEMRVEKVETYATLPVAERFFNSTIVESKYLGKALSTLSLEDMKKFSNELDFILKGIKDAKSKRKLVTACLAYIRDKQEEVA